jgi:hypothetical protein
MPHSAPESDVTLLLPSPRHKRRCSEEFVDELSQRVMRLPLEELGRCFGDGWCREIEPWLVLEGPGLGFKLLIVKVDGWELVEMGTRINEVFNEHWKREMAEAGAAGVRADVGGRGAAGRDRTAFGQEQRAVRAGAAVGEPEQTRQQVGGAALPVHPLDRAALGGPPLPNMSPAAR